MNFCLYFSFILNKYACSIFSNYIRKYSLKFITKKNELRPYNLWKILYPFVFYQIKKQRIRGLDGTAGGVYNITST